jgi:D-alanine-D-alanine ligase-like ATP-grasp enzyme/acylphosphatase
MEELSAEWLPHLSPEVVSGVQGNLLDAYAVALEGWRRGLTLRWHAKDTEKFKQMTTWFVDTPGQLFSLSSDEKTHYFFRTRGDKVTNEAVAIGKDKERTKQVLKQADVPVPEGRQFHEGDADDVVRDYVSDVGYPVVLKPTDGSFGRGVMTNIKNEQDLEYALTYVRTELNIKNVIAEQHISGEEYRIYVVGNQVVGAINRIPAHVVGDGVSSIESLTADKNKARQNNPRLISCPLKLDNETIRFIGQQGYSKEDIPKKGEIVFFSKKSNISSGGDPVDVLDELPSGMKEIAINAIHAVPGLEHGAVDLMIHTNNKGEMGYVLELNPTAQIGSILFPLRGKARDVPKAIIDYYFPETKSSAQLNSFVYFDLQEVLAPIATKAAAITEVAPLKLVPLSGKKFTLAGDVESLDFHHEMEEKAIELSLMGRLMKNGTETIDIVVVGEEELIKAYNQFIHELSNEANINMIHSEEWLQPIKLGFEIQGERKNLLIALDQSEDYLINAKKELQKLEKQYHQMLKSRSWKITEPVRKAGNAIKKLVKRG